MNDRGEAASAGVTEQATGQEERNEWEWKQTKAGAGHRAGGEERVGMEADQGRSRRKAGKDDEKQVVFHSSTSQVSVYTVQRTDSLKFWTWKAPQVRMEGRRGEKAQRDDNSCSLKRKWACPGCEKGGRGRSLRRMENGDFCTSYGVLLRIGSGSGRMSGKGCFRDSTLDTRHSSQIRGLKAGPDFCAAMVDGGYAAAPVSRQLSSNGKNHVLYLHQLIFNKEKERNKEEEKKKKKKKKKEEGSSAIRLWRWGRGLFDTRLLISLARKTKQTAAVRNARSKVTPKELPDP
ncbi:hypothetical protein CNYM01_12236 [Colletotrichum nymphaeae SA-01]|uniref:Uncharacterized protein n=1 Tax=Colletotrichum nymphaeae SA-01 TaxID=1460502 RepID=A0A135RW87_9PEZI|nr:hypothetical protein CNYM01_12236 [Colletotrichum nymphaeae SA-01]